MNTERPPFEAAVSDDGQTLTVRLAAASFTANAQQLDELIAWLGHYRSKVAPAVETDYRRVQRFLYADLIQIVPIPPEGTHPATETGANFLFQSPLFGWFQHPAKPEFCAQLLHFLLSQGQPPPGGAYKH